MHIVRFADERGTVHIGLRSDALWKIPGTDRIADLLRLRLDDLHDLVTITSQNSPFPEPVRLLPPVDGLTEVWASGVTYQRSKHARMEESTEQSVYDRVYTAERPELFFKSLPWRVVTDGEPIGIRSDSAVNVPEPELAVVINAFGEVVGYNVCDDVSSRTLEGENPLYLPQAKIYAGSCALSAGIRPAWEVPDYRQLTITLEVRRDGGLAYKEQVSTAELRRDLNVLIDYLVAPQPFPDGAILSTGTGIVPELGFSLRDGDLVHIAIDEVGELNNPVTSDSSTLNWLTDAIHNPLARKAAQ